MSDEIKDQPTTPPIPVERKGFLTRNPALSVSEPVSVEPDAEDVATSNSWIKLLSGRFILTVVGAICFYKFSNTVCKIMIAKQESIDSAVVISLFTNLIIIVSNIITFYFVRKAMTNQTPTNGGTDNGG